VFYDGTNGILEMWVLIASLSDSTVVYLGYGDTGLTADGSSTSTWPTAYNTVSHYGDGTTLSVADSSQSANHGTNNNSVAAGAGKIGGAGYENATANRNVSYPTIAGMSGAGAYTVQFWSYMNAFPTAIPVYVSYGAGFELIGIEGNSSANSIPWVAAGGLRYGTVTDGPTTGAWKLTHLVFDGSLTGDDNRYKMYVDGAAKTISWLVGGVGTTLDSNSDAITISNTNTGWPDWYFDEVRFYAGALSADWILTEYRNQNAPTTFWPTGTEVAVGGGGRTTKNTAAWNLGTEIGMDWRAER
jgi:hypothetical protein